MLNVMYSAIALLMGVVPCSKQYLEQFLFSTPKMMERNGGLVWEALWSCLSAFDILQNRVTVKEFNDARKYGPHAELYFSLLTRPEGLLLPTGNDPLSQGALGVSSWIRASGPNGPELGPASSPRVEPARNGAR